MMTTQGDTLVLKDREGDYYLLPQATLERGRVPAEYGPAVERLVAESAGADAHDTQGHILPALIIGACWGATAAIVIGNTGDVPIGHILEDIRLGRY